MRKTVRMDLLALLTIAGVAGANMAQAADSNTAYKSSALKVIDHQCPTSLADEGKEAACGKGSCGTDEAGAKAAQEKHAGQKKSKAHHKSTQKKTEEKPHK